MISIPLDSKYSTSMSELYGNAPYFALLDPRSGQFKVIKNEESGNGPKLVPFLKDKGTSATVFMHMGDKLFKLYDESGIQVFTCKEKESSIDSIYRGLLSESLLKVDSSNYIELTDECSCECKGS